MLFLNNFKLAQSNQYSMKNLSFTVPVVLNEKDIKVYLEINKYQNQGNWKKLMKKKAFRQ